MVGAIGSVRSASALLHHGRASGCPPCMTNMRHARPTSALLQKLWDVPEVGRVSVVIPATPLLVRLDAEWPALRRATDIHQPWRWQALMAGKRDTFAVLQGSHPLGLWCNARAAPLTLPEGRFYRLDNIEIHPARRGSVIGPFLLSLVATRALELGASSVVLAAFPIMGLAQAYLRAGAVQRCPRGWNCPRELIPFVFESDALLRLKDFADALLEDPET